MSEHRAAGEFLFTMLRIVEEHWPRIAARLRELGLRVPTGERTQVEFLCAIVALELRAVRNLLSKQQAERITEHVLRGLSLPDSGSDPEVTLNGYDNLLSRSTLPGEAASRAFLSHIHSESHSNASEVEPVVSILSAYLVALCGFWKALLERHELIE